MVKVEKRVDVIQAIKDMRDMRLDMVNSEVTYDMIMIIQSIVNFQ